MKFAVVAGILVLLGITAFRRVRGVLSPGPLESAGRPAGGTPPDQARTALVTAVLAVLAMAAVVGIVWVGLEVFFP